MGPRIREDKGKGGKMGWMACANREYRTFQGVPKLGGIVLNLFSWSGCARVPWRTLSRSSILGGTAEGPCRSGYS